jgi:hypothetical protein
VNRSPIRFALVGLALVVGAWLALGLRGVRLMDDGDAVLAKAQAGEVPAAEVNAGLDDYAKAGRLSPDLTPLIRQGQLAYAAGREHDASVIAQRATEAEPDNLQAWYLAWVVAPPKTPAKQHAEDKVLDLNPWFEYALQRARLAAQRKTR